LKIHDALIYELIRPDKGGKPTGDIFKIVGETPISFKIEHMVRSVKRVEGSHLSVFEQGPKKTIMEEMAPDIAVYSVNSKKVTAIEVETDVDFDFGLSLRQVKKYKSNKDDFDDVLVILPEDYKQFAPLYMNEGFKVWLWKAIRKWECLKCGNITEKKGPIQPQCKNCKNTRKDEFRLKGLKEPEFYEFTFS
jgi:hypothetical protein